MKTKSVAKQLLAFAGTLILLVLIFGYSLEIVSEVSYYCEVYSEGRDVTKRYASGYKPYYTIDVNTGDVSLTATGRREAGLMSNLEIIYQELRPIWYNFKDKLVLRA